MDKLMMVALGTLSFLVILGGVQVAQADNLVDNNVDPIVMQVDSTNSSLKVKIVSNTAQSQSGDPELDCNANDGSPATVNLLISPSTGLTYTPNPVTFDYCGNPQKTIKFAATIGGTYTVTAEVIDTGEGGDSPTDVYHLEPFGTITVIVIDTTPPDTFIDSGPVTPTAKDSATFTFSSNEAGSTFECSLDGGAFTACASGDEFTGLALGPHTFAVQATDQSGNTDPSPAEFSWTIEAVTIGITSVVPGTTIWGEPIEVQGVANLVDLTALTAELDWGDDTTTPLTIASGSWGPETHTYDTPSDTPYTLTATLKDGDTVIAFGTSTVTINKHQTALTLVMPEEKVTEGAKFLGVGVLTDTSLTPNAGVDGRTIAFTGDGAPANTQTQGVTFEGQINIALCGSCAPDVPPIGDSAAMSLDDPGDNNVVDLGVGGKIMFPSSTAQAIVYFQGMGTTEFKYKLVQYPNDPLDCNALIDGLQEECSTAGDPGIIGSINAISDFVAVGIPPVKVYNGVKEVLITEVDGSTSTGSVRISAIVTTGRDTEPSEQYLLSFGAEPAPSSPQSPFTVNPGSYSAIGVAPEYTESGSSLTASFGGDTHYEASTSGPAGYGLEADLNGLGSNFIASGSGTSVVEWACAGLSDSDNDGICDEFETAPFEIFIDGISPAVSWPFPPGEEPDLGLPDVYYEIDCMTGFCPTQTELNYVESRFAKEGIKMHLMLDQTNLTVCNPLNVWSDGDADECNDFRSIKKNNYGTAQERVDAGGDLGQGKALLVLKSQAVRYILFAKNIGTAGGGPTGIAEFKGNDAVVAIDSIPAAAADVSETRIGTLMHEIGHNLGLLHGGTDDDNCKPNYISVMNYNRQIPHSKMPVPAAGATTSVGWYGDYSHGNVLLKTSGGALIGDGKTIDEGDLDDSNKLTKSGTWRNYDDNGDVSSFRIMWGTPLEDIKVQTANTAAQIDWDKDADAANDSNQVHDLNFLSVIVGGSQFPACAEASLISTLATGGNDYSTMKSNIAKFNGASSAALGLNHGAEGNDNFEPELNAEALNALSSGDFQFLGVENPLNNVAFGEPGNATSKKGNTIHVRFSLNDESGTPITGDNFQSYGIEKIILLVAKVDTTTDPIEAPGDDQYFPPATSTQGGSADFFTWDGSKWGFQWGTKPLQLGTYAGRIVVVLEGGQGVNMSLYGNDISFVVRLVKN